MRQAVLLVVSLFTLVILPVAAQDDSSSTDTTETSEPVITRSTAPDPAGVTTEEIIGGLDRPLFLTVANDGSGRLFVLEQSGRVIVYDEGITETFININDLLTNDVDTASYTERGLLGLAFAPDYADSGEFYINYTDIRGDTVVARYRVSADDPNRADPDSAEIIFTQSQPYPNHNGGHMVFGDDGYLYIGLGDGGSANDPLENGQDTSNVLGTIIRLDVSADARTADAGYAIPDDNPFVGDDNARDEIWSYGLRNPWRFSFDRATGDMYIGDVGQNQWEEVNFEPADSPGGVNYGWDAYEATHQFENEAAPDAVFPFAEYNHSMGCSVTGGYVYRGSAIPDLQGVYLYSDYCSGNLWAAYRYDSGAWQSNLFQQLGMQVSSFGEDEDGELYILNYRGTVLKFVPAG